MIFNPNFSKLGGLVPVIAQDWKTKEVLMLAFMNEEAWQKSLELKEAVYYSRTRNKLWRKGETSGHVQKIKEILIDCDEDSIILLIEQVGGASCHTGYNSCFYRKLRFEKQTEPIPDLSLQIFKNKKIFDPEKVYKDNE